METTTMIERSEPAAKRGRAAPRLDLSGAEWKLSIAAWLAVVYTVSWFAIGSPGDGDPVSSGGAAQPLEPLPSTRSAGQPAQPSARVASGGQRAPAAASRPRVVTTRSTRIRTRSS